MLDLFEKEIALEGAIMEHSVNDIVAMNDIEGFYTEGAAEAGEKIKEFIEKVIEAIRKFFNEIKEKIEEKINEAKYKKALNDLTIASRKGLKKISVKASVDEKKAIALYSDFIAKATDCSKKIANAKTTKEIIDIRNKMDELNDAFYLKCEDLVTDLNLDSRDVDHMLSSKTMQEAYELTDKALERINAENVKQANYWEKFEKEFEEQMEKEKEQMEKEAEEIRSNLAEKRAARKAAMQSTISKISSAGKKVGTMLANNKGKVLVGVTAALAAFGAKIGYDKYKDSKNNVTESVYDDFDFLNL